MSFQYNPDHPIGTCGKCGGEMIHNVPRMGNAGSFIHKQNNSIQCPNQMSQPTNCPCGHEFKTIHGWTTAECGSFPKAQSELCIEREARQKAEAELADYKRISSDLVASVNEWKAKRNAELANNQKLRALLVKIIKGRPRMSCEWEIAEKELEAL